MKVTLLNSANQQLITKDDFFDSEHLAKQAAAICVDKLDNPSDKGFEKVIKSGHYSILEHPCKKDGCKEIKPCGNPYEKSSSDE